MIGRYQVFEAWHSGRMFIRDFDTMEEVNEWLDNNAGFYVVIDVIDTKKAPEGASNGY